MVDGFALALGAEALNVGNVVIPEIDAAPDVEGPCCAVCVKPGGNRRRNRLRTFALEVIDEKRIGRGRRAGRIRLCERCWARSVADARASKVAA